MTADEALPPVLARKHLSRAKAARAFGPESGGVVVFTNGCFDLIHRGHVTLLLRARELGDRLLVGLNSDPSVRRLKGPGRPLMPEPDRIACLAALEAVDGIVVFEEDTPAELIAEIQPHILVKGGDYRPEEVVGREVVEARGGRVVIVPTLPGRSTTQLIERAIESRGRSS